MEKSWQKENEEKLQKNDCLICQDITKKYVYMRNQKNIREVISFEPAIYNNMLIDFDSDFDDEYAFVMQSDLNLAKNVKAEAENGSFIDLKYEKNSLVFKMPEDLVDFPKDVFITITRHNFDHAFHGERELTTIHLTQSDEGLGEVNEGVESDIVSLRSMLAQVDCDTKLMPINDNIADHYVLAKYSDKIEKSFTL